MSNETLAWRDQEEAEIRDKAVESVKDLLREQFKSLEDKEKHEEPKCAWVDFDTGIRLLLLADKIAGPSSAAIRKRLVCEANAILKDLNLFGKNIQIQEF